MTKFTCVTCEEIGFAAAGQAAPPNWSIVTHPKLGPLEYCPNCIPKPKANMANVHILNEDGTTQKFENSTREMLVNFLKSLNRIESEIADLREQAKEIKAEAKIMGFDVATLSKLLGQIRGDQEKRREKEIMLSLYEATISEGTEAFAPAANKAQSLMQAMFAEIQAKTKIHGAVGVDDLELSTTAYSKIMNEKAANQ